MENIDLKMLKIIEILDQDRSYICFHAQHKEESLVIKLRKTQFKENNNLNYWKDFVNILSDFTLKFQNDIFFKYNSHLKYENEIDLEVIYPADKKILEKCKKEKYVVLTETIEIYNLKIVPYVESLDTKHKEFINNILYEGKEELYYKTEKFVIVKDYKFVNTDEVYYLGIVYDSKIRSLRDLKGEHLPLLIELYNFKFKLEETFNESVQVYVHYYPSFWHFHIHYVGVSLDVGGNIINRSWDLKSVISNLRISENYYKNADLDIIVKKNSDLHKLFN